MRHNVAVSYGYVWNSSHFGFGLVEMAQKIVFIFSLLLTLAFLGLSFSSEIFIIPLIVLGAYTFSVRE